MTEHEELKQKCEALAVLIGRSDLKGVSMKEVTKEVSWFSAMRITCSVYGNPRFNILWDDEDGYHTGKTQSDGQPSYNTENCVTWKEQGKHIFITYHETRTGNVIITKIDKEK